MVALIMSRSRRKHPAGGITTADSDKYGKTMASRVARRVVREALARDLEGLMPLKREVSDVWSFSKDGKKWHGWRYPELLRK